jgi:Integrase core domain
MATVKYLESVTKQQAKTTLQNTLKFYGLDAVTDLNKILPPPSPVGGQIIMRNLTDLQNKDLVNSVPGMQLQKKLGEKTTETEAQANSILIGFQNAVQHGLPLTSKALTAFQTFEDFHYKPVTSNTAIGDNLIFVADRMAAGKFGSKFVLIPKALQTSGKGLRFLSKNGNALGLGLSVGIFISDRVTKQPLKCTSVLDVVMSAAGNCYDNAQAESFFSRFKAELLENGRFENIEQEKSEIFSYIEAYYNRRRIHSSLGKSPAEFEKQLKINNKQRSVEESFVYR